MDYYKVVIDQFGEVIETKNMGPAPAENRSVGVIAESPMDARKKARILVGLGGAR